VASATQGEYKIFRHMMCFYFYVHVIVACVCVVVIVPVVVVMARVSPPSVLFAPAPILLLAAT
jgi:hypothetical protein